MARTPSIDWELYKAQLLQLKSEGKSLTEINKVLFDKLGKSVTNARLSQIFTQWKTTAEVTPQQPEVASHAN